jgi:nucleotide-binding universal stress UspA family protein
MKIMVALDRTEKDVPVLTRAAEIAKAASAELILLNVFSPLVDMGHAAPGPIEQQERQVEAERRAYLQEKAELVTGVPVRIVAGKRQQPEEVHDCIARLAREHDADILAVSSKRLASLLGTVLGSTALMLLRISSCPVLVVRPA